MEAATPAESKLESTLSVAWMDFSGGAGRIVMASELAGTGVSRDARRRGRNRVLDVVSLIVVLLAFSVFASVAFQKLSFFRYAVLFAVGQSQHCSCYRSVRLLEEAQDWFEIFERMTAASRVVETEGDGFTLWETPRGKF